MYISFVNFCFSTISKEEKLSQGTRKGMPSNYLFFHTLSNHLSLSLIATDLSVSKLTRNIFFVGSGVLVLLIFADQIVQV